MRSLTMDPQKITGSWAEGFTLDVHMKSADFVGYDGAGHAQFENKVRSELGEAVYQLKYGTRDPKEARRLAITAASFAKKWKVKIDAVVPMPASKRRTVQPVEVVAKHLGELLGAEVVNDAVSKIKDTPQLKNVGVDERKKLLAGAHKVDPTRIKGRNILLLDDLFQSGATMNAVAAILRSKGGAAKVYALALTRTKR